MRAKFAVSTTVVTLAATLFAVQLKSSLAQNAPAPTQTAPTQAAPTQAAPAPAAPTEAAPAPAPTQAAPAPAAPTEAAPATTPTQAAPPQPASGAAPTLTEAALRGQAIFGEKCSLCHNADSAEQKIGPGLKGFYKRGTYTSSGDKVTDENLVNFISHGQGLMPAFKDTLGPAKIQDAVAYVKTL